MSSETIVQEGATRGEEVGARASLRETDGRYFEYVDIVCPVPPMVQQQQQQQASPNAAVEDNDWQLFMKEEEFSSQEMQVWTEQKKTFPLHAAVCCWDEEEDRDAEMVAGLVREMDAVSINAYNDHGLTALHVAVIKENPKKEGQIVRILVGVRGIDLEARDRERGMTALHFACCFGRSVSARIILDAMLARGMDSSQILATTALTGRTPLHFAALDRRLTMVKMLLESLPGMDVNAMDKTKQGKTALHVAVEMRQIDVLEVLCSADGVDANIQTRTSRDTALHLLMTSSFSHTTPEDSLRAARMLLKVPGIDINLSNAQGETALSLACSSNLFENIVRLLLDAPGIDVNRCNPANGSTLLIQACLNKNENLAYQLMEHPNIDVNVVNRAGDTALTAACSISEMERVAVKLLTMFPSIDVNHRGANGFPLLHTAILQSMEILNLLLENPKIDVSCCDDDGKTLLMLATVCSDDEVVKKLLTFAETDVNAQTKDGRSVLHFLHEDLPWWRQWWKCKESPGAHFSIFFSSLGYSRRAVYFMTDQQKGAARNRILKLILAAPNLRIDILDVNNCTPLLAVLPHEKYNIARKLLLQGADIYGISKLGQTALHAACAGGHSKIVCKLLKLYAARSSGRGGQRRNSMEGEGEDDDDCGKGAASETADTLFATTSSAATSSEGNVGNETHEHHRDHDASSNSKTSIRGLSFAEIVNFRNAEMQTPLHVACESGKLKSIRALLRFGGDVIEIDAQDRAGRTPLHLACARRQLKCARALMWAGANINIENLYKSTPIMTGNMMMMHALIRSSLPRIQLDRSNSEGNTLLHLCCLNHCESLTPTVLALLAPRMTRMINTGNKFGCTALHLAVIAAESEELVEILLKVPGIDVNARPPALERYEQPNPRMEEVD